MIRLRFTCILLTAMLVACGASTPLKRLERGLEKYPEFSVTLADMKVEGNFFKDFYHRYKVIYGQPGEETKDGEKELVYRDEITDWEKVDEREYERLEGFLGMTVLSKSKDGKISEDRYPPGYQYVGDSRYGQWRHTASGGSFWEFYGKYAFFSSMFNMFNRPIYRDNWNTFNSYRGSGRPYYGPNREYGTNGNYTRRTNPSFFERRRQRDAARKSAFSERVRERTRRSSMSNVRGRRSGGFGK